MSTIAAIYLGSADWLRALILLSPAITMVACLTILLLVRQFAIGRVDSRTEKLIREITEAQCSHILAREAWAASQRQKSGTGPHQDLRSTTH